MPYWCASAECRACKWARRCSCVRGHVEPACGPGNTWHVSAESRSIKFAWTPACTKCFCYGCSAEGVASPHLIVVPLSTAANWLREFQTWAPQLNVVALSGNRVRSLRGSGSGVQESLRQPGAQPVQCPFGHAATCVQSYYQGSELNPDPVCEAMSANTRGILLAHGSVHCMYALTVRPGSTV